MKLVALSIISVALATSTMAVAGGHEGNTAVKARQAHMQLYQFNAGYLGSVAQGKADYDAETAQAAANNLLAMATMNQGRMWAAGTDNMSIDGTRAQPGMWEDFGKVVEISQGLVTAAENLAAVAGDGADAVGAAIGPVFGSCTACHKAFRAPAN